MPEFTYRERDYKAGEWLPITQSEWCGYRVIGPRADYVIHVIPEPGYEHGLEAAGIAAVWDHADRHGALGLLLVGCDVAADPDDIAAMRSAVLERPADLHTGLVKLWPESTGREEWIWSHRGGTVGFPAATQDLAVPVAYVSLGFLWAPARLLELAAPHLAARQWGETDVYLSETALNHGIAAHVVPDCRPKHLHYQKEHDGGQIRARSGIGGQARRHD